MKVALNTMVKNEEIMLTHVLSIWKNYPVDYFIFYDDNSTDNTNDVIYDILPKEKIIILNDKLEKFNEGYQRQRMIDESRKLGVDYSICLDADELLSANIVKEFSDFIKIYETTDLYLYWYNVVNDTLSEHRSDPLYENNYRCFILPLKDTGNLDVNLWQYHTPRTPNVNLPRSYTKNYGVLHLQSSNKKYYAMKQLWYKHYEHLNYGHSFDYINQRYDPVVNNLNFNEKITPFEIVNGINIDLSFMKGLEKTKGYFDFVKENYKEELTTFGKEYII
jgi:hypothetical protein